MAATASSERVFDALGDATRRRIFERVRRGTRSVGEIADGMEITRPAVSQHLRVLKTAGLVVARVEGTRHLYAVDPKGLEAMRKWVDGFWADALTSFQKATERAAAADGRER